MCEPVGARSHTCPPTTHAHTHARIVLIRAGAYIAERATARQGPTNGETETALRSQEEMKAASTKDTLDQWAGKSVWSLVCAMELGLISDTTASRGNVEVSSRSEVAAKSPRNASSSPPLRISPRLRTVTPRFGKKRANVGRRGRRRGKRGSKSGKKVGRKVYANDSTITVDQFWRSRKRKLGRPKKQNRSADLLSSSFSRPTLSHGSCRTTRSRSVSNNNNNNNNNNNDLLANSTDAPRFERRVSRDNNGAWKNSSKTVLHEKTNDENTNENDVTRSNEGKGFESKDKGKRDSTESTKFEEIHTLPLMKRIFRESGVVYGVENERKDGRRDTDEKSTTICEAGKKDCSVKKACSSEGRKGVVRAKALKGNEENQEVRRVTRGSMKIGKDLSVGKLVWGYCAGWWPGKNFFPINTFLSNSACSNFLFAFDRSIGKIGIILTD